MHCAYVLPDHSSRMGGAVRASKYGDRFESDLGNACGSATAILLVARRAWSSVVTLDCGEEVLAVMRRCVRRGQRSRVPHLLVQDDYLGDAHRYGDLARLVSLGDPDRLLHDDALGNGAHRGMRVRPSVLCSWTTDRCREALERYAPAPEGKHPAVCHHATVGAFVVDCPCSTVESRPP